MPKLYRVTGKPAGAPIDLLQSRAIGDEFEADLDKDLERQLVDVGALEVAKQRVTRQEDKAEEKAASPKEKARDKQ